MAEDRKIHPQCGLDARVARLTDLEFRVWVQYILNANDLGVMPWTASALQHGNTSLDKRGRRVIEAAMTALESAGLVQLYQHDGTTYAWARKWQTWQGIRYPRRSPYPLPPIEDAPADLIDLVQRYTERHGDGAGRAPDDFGKVSEMTPEDSRKVSASRARPRSAPAGSPNPNPSTAVPGEESLREGDRAAVVEILDPEPDDEPVSPTPAAWRPAQPRPTHVMRQEGNHKRDCAPWAYAACRVGACVPKYLWRRWETRKPDLAALQAFVEAWADRAAAAGDDERKFWPAAFEAHFGTAAPAPVPARLSAAQRTLANFRSGQ